MTDVRDFTPLYVETLARIRARMDADANAGLQADDPQWEDTREGSFYWDMTQVCALECARLWDALGSETVAAAFPSVAWGEYLDEHAATFGLVREPAVQATGSVLFTGQAGVLIGSGTQVIAPPSDPTMDEITFKTTASGTTSAQLSAPSPVTPTPSNTGGHLLAATYIYHVTAYNQYGETLAGADITAVIGGTNTGEVALSWPAVTGAVGYRIYRSTAIGTPGSRIGDVALTSFTDDGTAAPGELEPTANTTAGVILPVIAMDAGAAGDLGAGAISMLDTLVPGITQVINEAATQGGLDAEDDDSLRGRILAEYQGSGVGNINWYVQQALNTAGVQRAVAIAIWNGPGTVLVVPMLANGGPVSSSVVGALQNQLDPVAGKGHGTAPVGATVTVETTVPLNVTIAATIGMETGYSLDGTSGTISTRAAIVAAITAYLATLNPGDTIGYQLLEAAILGVEGVTTVTGLTINGGTVDIALTVSPPEYPVLQTPTLT